MLNAEIDVVSMLTRSIGQLLVDHLPRSYGRVSTRSLSTKLYPSLANSDLSSHLTT